MATKKRRKKTVSSGENRLRNKLKKMTSELAEANETLRAIRAGEVDALVVSDAKGDRIFTLKNADQPYRIMVETMNEGAATLRKDGMIFYCNRRFSDLLSFPQETVIGSSIYDYITTTDKPEFQELVDSENEKRVHKLFTLTTSLGQKVATQIAMSQVEIEDGEGVCIIATDLTERKIAEDNLRNSRDLLEVRVKERTGELAKAVKVRDDFLSIASHELKTPLTSLKLQAQMRKRRLQKGDLAYFETQKIEKMVEDDERQVNRLTRLVDDMLDLSRLNTGKLSLELETVDLCQVVSDVINRFAPQLQASDVKVAFSPLCPIVGTWDRSRIEQIFTNLLTNALKYGDHKPVEISVEQVNNQARLVVKDYGIGIAEKDHERIFGQFERAVLVSEVSGLGLGLYIVKQLIEAHKGNISVKSKLGSGSTFVVELPLNPFLDGTAH